jgi:hypothetical protein
MLIASVSRSRTEGRSVESCRKPVAATGSRSATRAARPSMRSCGPGAARLSSSALTAGERISRFSGALKSVPVKA